MTASKRGFKTSTIIKHLIKAKRIGLPVDVERLSDRVRSVIEEAMSQVRLRLGYVYIGKVLIVYLLIVYL